MELWPITCDDISLLRNPNGHARYVTKSERIVTMFASAATVHSIFFITRAASFVLSTQFSCDDHKSVHSERKSIMFSPKCIHAALALPILFTLTSTLLLFSSVPASAQSIPISNHVVLIVDENTSYSTVYPNGMPWLVGEGNKYGFSSNYFSNVSGSLLDYLWLASGSSETAFHCNGNDCYFPNTTNKDPITDENIFHLMDNQPISWKVYAESYLNAGGNVN